LNSSGRIYTDADGPINYNEYGAYTQLTKKLLDDRLKFTGSLRYDKSKNFEGNYSPRVSLVYSAGESRKHNFRASFQTGFRNPSTQDQYIGFNVGSAILLGSAPDNLTRYKETLPVSTALGQSLAGGATVNITGLNAYNNSFTASSIDAFDKRLKGPLLVKNGVQESEADRLSDALSKIKKTNFKFVKPEKVKAIELGYRSFIQDMSVDINGYYNVYNNFIGNANVLAPLYGIAQDNPSANPSGILTNKGTQSLNAIQTGNYRAFQLYTNTDVEIKSLGFGLGLAKKVYKDFELGVNYNYAEFNFNTDDTSFEAGFNTPKHRVKASFGNEKLFQNFGFNVSGRWNSEYLWQSTMADGMIASATVIDAQVNYVFPKLKSTLKIGAANIGGKEYIQVLGAGSIGQQYFASWTINP
jgi:outer membrane cobalamin receptor